jgi:APA family basic amino acid/polyamine antiporter
MASNQLLATKPLEVIMAEMEGDHRLKRALGPWALTALGIGAIIGTGIFVLVGKAAALTAGPALVVSFVVAGLACVFAAFCYAEFASMVPVAGSAYTYAYATLGELMAWIIGWDLILEYAVASSTVAHGWSHYFQDLLIQFDINWFQKGGWLEAFNNAPFDYNAAKTAVDLKDAAGNVTGTAAPGAFFFTGKVLDLPAVVITFLVTVILVIGIRESATFNAVMVAVKVGIVLFVIAVGAFFVRVENWTNNFAPYGWGGVTFFGHDPFGTGSGGPPVGMMAGAAMIIFAYLGFDAVSTQAEEAKNPRRDMPIGIIGSLLICTVLYIAVAAVLTGMVPYQQIKVDAPVAEAFGQVGLGWARFIIAIGALTGITSVLLVMMLGQPRIFFAMARDGLLPKGFFSAVHPRFRTPWKSTILTGLVVAAGSSLLPLNILADLTNIGTLFAFVVVCGAVMVMRYTHPNVDRPFRAPFGLATPILGIVLCLLLMFSLPEENWLRLVIWLVIGLAIYFGYGRYNSKLGKVLRGETAPGSTSA